MSLGLGQMQAAAKGLVEYITRKHGYLSEQVCKLVENLLQCSPLREDGGNKRLKDTASNHASISAKHATRS